MKLIALTSKELLNIVIFGIQNIGINGKGNSSLSLHYLKLTLVGKMWLILRRVITWSPWTRWTRVSVKNRASPTQKHGKKRFAAINIKKIKIFSNINHCHKAIHLKVLLFQKCLVILCPKRPPVPLDCLCHRQIPQVEWFIH